MAAPRSPLLAVAFLVAGSMCSARLPPGSSKATLSLEGLQRSVLPSATHGPDDLPSLSSAKPDVRLALYAALKNLSRAACDGGAEALTSILGENVTVLAPGLAPQLLNDTESVVSFFSSSFLPCAVEFTILEVVHGKGAHASKPQPGTADKSTSTPSANGAHSYLAATLLRYVSYPPALDVGEAVALWSSNGKISPENESGARFSWNLTVIGWASALPPSAASTAVTGNALASSASLATPPQHLARPLHQAHDPEPLNALLLEPEPEREPEGGEGERGTSVQGSSLEVWTALEDAVRYFNANATAGDGPNATLIVSKHHPYWDLNPGLLPKVAVSEAERRAVIQPALGLTWNGTLLEVWQLKAVETSSSSSPSAILEGDAIQAFAIQEEIASYNGTYVSYGHTLLFFSLESIPTASGVEVNQFTLRWRLLCSCTPLPEITSIS